MITIEVMIIIMINIMIIIMILIIIVIIMIMIMIIMIIIINIFNIFISTSLKAVWIYKYDCVKVIIQHSKRTFSREMY